MNEKVYGRAGIEKQKTKKGENIVDYGVCPFCRKKELLVKGPPRKVKCMFCKKEYWIRKT